jgi:SNF2 family DNA or RNA helicase
MVRRLKQDLREIGEEFPQRYVLPIVIDNLPEDAPELKLSRLLQQYRNLREEKLKDAAKSTQTTAMLVITSLQKRLLSSIEAFARTLKVHRTGMEKQAINRPSTYQVSLPLLFESPGADDERAEFSEEEVIAEEDAQMAAASMQAAGQTARELAILDEMADVANASRYQPDPRIQQLVEWIRQNLCPDLGQPNAAWLERRVIIFTEYTDTKRYLQQQLQTAIAGSNREQERIDVFHGGIGEERREAIKSAFNADPARHPLRILIATDAAREGVNLQNNCADLFHFDVPWNPSRMEQRNGRIDRKLQRSPVVHCYYFVLPQRTEDKVLDVLVRKTATIQQELGSLAPVVERNVSRLLANGIRHQEVNNLADSINQAEQLNNRETINTQVINEELEQARLRQQDLTKQVEQLQEMLQASRKWLGLDDNHFRNA